LAPIERLALAMIDRGAKIDAASWDAASWALDPIEDVVRVSRSPHAVRTARDGALRLAEIGVAGEETGARSSSGEIAAEAAKMIKRAAPMHLSYVEHEVRVSGPMQRFSQQARTDFLKRL
jgi:hypothetical protein